MSSTCTAHVRLTLTMPPQMARASHSRPYAALFLKPVTKATAVPTSATGCQGIDSQFWPNAAHATVGAAATNTNTTVSRSVQKKISTAV